VRKKAGSCAECGEKRVPGAKARIGFAPVYAGTKVPAYLRSDFFRSLFSRRHFSQTLLNRIAQI
jgi:hypothetical protein